MKKLAENKFDLLIIGGGPGGYSTAIAAAKEGLSVALFEAATLGGTCLNVGCIPTKYLLDKAAAIEKVRSLTNRKIFKEAGFYSFRKIQTGREEVVKKLTTGVEYLLKANKVTLIRGNASLCKRGRVRCGNTEYEGENIIIATGSEAVRLPIPGAEYTITSTEALALEKVPEKLVVIGGGVIGMELASAFCSFGSEVTVIEVLPELFMSEDRKAVHYMKKELEKLLSHKRNLNLQLFAEEGGDGESGNDDPEDKSGDGGNDDKKYTDEDVNNIINRKFAEWEKRQKEKSAKAAEAERLKNMTEEEKRKHEMEELQKKIAGYEKEKAIGAMTKVARGILNDSKIVVNDELLVNLVAEDAETTKANVENFVKNFNDAVQKAVAEALRGKTPRLKDGSKELTKEDILKIKNRIERQKAMAEHPELFR